MIDAAFSLIDHEGEPVSELSYRGWYLLVFFGFTHCKVVCPRALARLTGILGQLDRSVAERIRPLYISVDPDRDSPAVMKAFLASVAPRFTGLTGSRSEIDRAKASFRVFAERRDDPLAPDGYVVPHTAIAYLVDPAGRYLAHFADSVDAGKVVERLQSLVEAESPM